MNTRRLWFLVFMAGVLCVFLNGCAYLSETRDSVYETDELTVDIYDHYKDNFGYIVLQGRVNRSADIFVDGSKIVIENGNVFTVETDWDVGEPIVIEAEDREGNVKEFDFWPDREPPDEPENLRASHVTSNSVEFEWSENREPDMAGYKVYYGIKGGGMREVSGIVTEDSYEIIGLQNWVKGGANRTFRFYVKAVDKMGNESDPSDVLEVTLP